ncbi:hypothetical protein ACSNN9_24510 [Micromonospora sp. URMC 107]|uniref:hypothetical protein n=1 Tax=Micromonospora sp. URMC 107 TaxID=3423418 RepID=UPI003F1A4229
MTYEAFYEPAGRFGSTPATAGPWDPAAQHAGPPSALLARALAGHDPVDDADARRRTPLSRPGSAPV